jgi:class 3 adenylate cyclase
LPSLPTGTVTFLFTDIEGSTRLLQQLGDRYADVLAGTTLMRNPPGWRIGGEMLL